MLLKLIALPLILTTLLLAYPSINLPFADSSTAWALTFYE